MGGSCDGPFLPLRVVLGAFNDPSLVAAGASSMSSSLSAAAASAATGGASSAQSSSPSSSSAPAAVAPIISTSYFATPRVGTSGGGLGRSVSLRLNKDGRVPMEDRKGPFDHFRPKSLVMSTVRVTAINISTTLSSFFTDQLKSEQDNEAMVESGKISPGDADEMNTEWEDREWNMRIAALPRKVGRALLRYHACTALMRLYEHAMARHVLRLDGGGDMGGGGNGGGGVGGGGSAVAVVGSSSSSVGHDAAVAIMDKLTRDPYRASLRTAQLVRGREHSPGRVVSSSDGAGGGIETSTSRELTRRMFSTCLWANVVPFLAELTVQQGVLIYGYGVYYMAKKRRIRERGMGGGGSQCKEGDDDGGHPPVKGEEAIGESAYALSLMVQSSRLTFARIMSWIAASAGGAIGCVVYPGWGTVFGIQIGDTVVGALID